MGVRTQQDRARERTRDLMRQLTDADIDGLADATGGLVADNGADRELFFPVLLEITDACAELIEASASISGAETTYVVDIVAEDGTRIAIDELPAALRALLRAVLARLEQHHGEQHFQLDLVARDADLGGKLDALTHGLACLSGLVGKIDAVDGLPPWLRS